MNALYNQDKNVILNLYHRLDLTIVKGNGAYLYDELGQAYLDMYSGIAVNSLGHGNSVVKAAVIAQLDQYLHLSNYFVSEPVISLATLLVANSFASKVFFTNSGTEANEAAIKLARKYGRSRHSDKIELLSFKGSFHGRTIGGMALTGQSKYKESFGQTLPFVDHVNFNDIYDLNQKVSEKTCAFFIELIQGEGGIQTVTEAFIAQLVLLSEKYDFLIVIDEIQTGLARTGELFAYQHYALTPHIVTLAKSLGGGLPLGAMLIAPALESVLVPGDHGTTFGGNPVACAAGTAVLDIMTSEGFLSDLKAKSAYLFERLNQLVLTYPKTLLEIRGRGMMLGIEVADDHATRIKEQAQAKGLLLNVTCGNVIRLLPPLTIQYSELDAFLGIFESLLT